MNQCTYCGAPLREGGAFCPNCGATQGESVSSVPSQEVLSEEKQATGVLPEKKFPRCPGKLLAIFISLFVIFFTGNLVLSWIFRGNPFYRIGAELGVMRSVRAVEKFLNMDDYDPEKIVKLLPKIVPEAMLEEEIGSDWEEDAVEDLEENIDEDEFEEYMDDLRDSSEYDSIVDGLKSARFNASYISVYDPKDEIYDDFEDDYNFKADVIAEVVFDISVKYDGDKTTSSVSLIMYAVDGKWYISPDVVQGLL